MKPSGMKHILQRRWHVFIHGVGWAPHLVHTDSEVLRLKGASATHTVSRGERAMPTTQKAAGPTDDESSSYRQSTDKCSQVMHVLICLILSYVQASFK
jgi:hypothetical protein